tara:strand:+ start:300 stop:650 length:351 start_codon:yes stop_codon:yes gene_type:complete
VLRKCGALINNISLGKTMATVTIQDIQAAVPVSTRTIRNWISKGLLPRPQLVSKGYKSGVLGIYAESVINTAQLLYATRCLPLADRKDIIKKNKRSMYSYIMEDDGSITLKIGIKN